MQIGLQPWPRPIPISLTIYLAIYMGTYFILQSSNCTLSLHLNMYLCQGDTCLNGENVKQFQQLGLLKLLDIHSLQLLCFIYDCMKGQPLAYFSNFFIPVHSIHQYHTRQASKGDIFLHSINATQFGIRSARYTGAILWNKLPILIRESPSKTVFKKNLQKWYLESYLSFEIE